MWIRVTISQLKAYLSILCFVRLGLELRKQKFFFSSCLPARFWVLPMGKLEENWKAGEGKTGFEPSYCYQCLPSEMPLPWQWHPFVFKTSFLKTSFIMTPQKYQEQPGRAPPKGAPSSTCLPPTPGMPASFFIYLSPCNSSYKLLSSVNSTVCGSSQEAAYFGYQLCFTNQHLLNPLILNSFC